MHVTRWVLFDFSGVRSVLVFRNTEFDMVAVAWYVVVVVQYLMTLLHSVLWSITHQQKIYVIWLGTLSNFYNLLVDKYVDSLSKPSWQYFTAADRMSGLICWNLTVASQMHKLNVLLITLEIKRHHEMYADIIDQSAKQWTPRSRTSVAKEETNRWK